MMFFSRLFRSRLSKENVFAGEIKTLVGFKPKDLSLYQLAFRHSSASLKGKGKNNERLEFLGDAVLSAIVADYLYKHYPNKSEGFLTSMRSKVVSRTNLNSVAKALGIESLIVSKLVHKKRAKSIGGDTLEALIGAIYLDRGLGLTASFIYQKILADKQLFEKLEDHVLSYKGLFIEWAQKERKCIEFALLEEWGQQHSKTFKMGLRLNNSLVSTGRGASKKEAEEEAAKKAYNELSIEA